MAVLEELRRDLSSDANDTNAAISAAQSAIAKMLTRAKEIERAELLPSQFTGVVRDYRFGVTSEGPKGKKMPSHRFEVEIPDTGLWLHVCVGSDRFDVFVATADPPIEEMTAAEINGKTITVQRDPGYGRTVPVCFGIPIDPGAPILIEDNNGVGLRKGDRVRIKEYPDSKATDATILRKDGQNLIYQRADRKGDSSWSFGRNGTTRPKTLKKIGSDADKVLLGVDRNGDKLFTGDKVTDLYDSRYPMCVLLGLDDDTQSAFNYAAYREDKGPTDYTGAARFKGQRAWGLRQDYVERAD